MSTPFDPVSSNQVIEAGHINRYIDPIEDLQKWREGGLPNLGDQDLGGKSILNLEAGTAQAPSLSFDEDPDTGLYRSGADEAGIATGGVERARFDSQGVTVSGLQVTTGAEAGKVLTSDASGVATWQALPAQDHGGLTGLGDDDHAQYAKLSGRASGQTLIGGTAAGENLTFQSTTHTTKGKILLGTASAYDQVNDRLGVGTATPSEKLEVSGKGRFSDQIVSTLASGTAPFSLASTTVVTNLNADLLDGKHASELALATHTHSTADLTVGTLAAARGGTGQSSFAKGDLLVASDASTLTRLASVAPSAGERRILQVDTSTATGLKWGPLKSTSLWNLSPSSGQTISHSATSWTDITATVPGSANLTTGGGVLIFFVSVGIEAIANQPTRLGFVRLSIDGSVYGPSSSGFKFVSPYNLSEVAMQSQMFVVTGLGSGQHTVKLQANMATSGEQAQISSNAHLSCVCIEL